MSFLPLAIYFEHPDWFRPLFAELDRRGTPYVKLDARRHSYDPSSTVQEYGTFFNRMSPSAYLRSPTPGIFYTLGLLAHLETVGTRVINGRQAFALETSKALQLTHLHSLGLPAPRSRVIHAPESAPEAAEGLRFPVVIKANIGGSGAGIVRYNTMDDLIEAVEEGTVGLGVDGTALVQEYVPARDGHITRVETLGGRFLYAINVYTDGETFDLCPADICQSAEGAKSRLRAEGYTPPAEVIADVERIVQTAGIDVGGIEYMVDDRDGQLVYYDINALSNFVADAQRLIGFDPFVKLVDYLETGETEADDEWGDMPTSFAGGGQ